MIASTSNEPPQARVAWVTGGSSGIGAAIVHQLQTAGHSVLDFDVQPPHEGVPWQELDVLDRIAVPTILSQCAEATGWPEILVLCAGVTGNAPLDHYPLEVWDRIQGVNLTGALLFLREVFPKMQERSYGRIVGISSGTALRPGFGTAAYASSKAGLIALMKVAALEGAKVGITANAVAPGITDTPMTRANFKDREGLKQAATSSRIANPQETVLEPDDIARTVAFLCEEGSARITGQVIHVNAGSIMP